jgi:hypothetical protein
VSPVFKAFVVTAMLFAPAMVQAKDLYECQMRQDAGNNGWIPTQVVVNYDAAKGEIVVFDPIIQAYQGSPVTAKIEIENEKRVTFNWRLKGTKDKIGQSAEFVYRLTVIKASSKATMTAQALNYAGPFSARGTCKISAG